MKKISKAVQHVIDGMTAVIESDEEDLDEMKNKTIKELELKIKYYKEFLKEAKGYAGIHDEIPWEA